jgi:DHA3 family multidrug efflux protein-like MFS transporter
VRKFYALLINTVAASIVNNFVWFAVTFWVYLETKSVIATSVMAGTYVGTLALSGFFLGSIVDRHKKKTSMLLSTVVSLGLYGTSSLVYLFSPSDAFSDPSSVHLWALILSALFGALAGNLRTIALSTTVTILFKEDERDKANGMVGTATGVSFLAASIFSGLGIGFLGIANTLLVAVVATIAILVHMLTVNIPEKGVVRGEHGNDKIDIKGTIRVVKKIPGLFALIFFNTFNNFLGGVFMALMDAYGLSMVSVQFWGILWGVLSTGFIVGGIIVSKVGLGSSPLRTLFRANILMWIVCMFFTVYPSVIPLAIGLFIYLCLIPVVEAAEQTIIQKVIPPERQGRVFGFAQSIEQAASPITAFLIGPLAQFFFIPYMSTGAGVELIGPWFGTGPARAMALIFTITGIIGLIVTVIAMRGRSYHLLVANYDKKQVSDNMHDSE